MDEVLQLSPKEPGVLDGIDFILLMIIDKVGWRWRINVLDWEDGRPVWSEEGFIEYRMSCGRTRGAKAVGRPSNLGVYDIGSDLTVVQLLAGSVRRQVDGVEPDQVTCSVVYGIPPILVMIDFYQLMPLRGGKRSHKTH